jgi:hypothetical protein
MTIVGIVLGFCIVVGTGVVELLVRRIDDVVTVGVVVSVVVVISVGVVFGISVGVVGTSVGVVFGISVGVVGTSVGVVFGISVGVVGTSVDVVDKVVVGDGVGIGLATGELDPRTQCSPSGLVIPYGHNIHFSFPDAFLKYALDGK